MLVHFLSHAWPNLGALFVRLSLARQIDLAGHAPAGTKHNLSAHKSF